jgi:uridylate kinase
VDGIYNADPKKVEGAVKFEEITYTEMIKLGLRVMDIAAVSLCKDNGLPMVVFSMRKRGNILRVVQGEKLGSMVTA